MRRMKRFLMRIQQMTGTGGYASLARLSIPLVLAAIALSSFVSFRRTLAAAPAA